MANNEFSPRHLMRYGFSELFEAAATGGAYIKVMGKGDGRGSNTPMARYPQFAGKRFKVIVEDDDV